VAEGVFVQQWKWDDERMVPGNDYVASSDYRKLQRDVPQWRPIETIPKDGLPFLCGWWSPTRDYFWICKAHWANGAVDGGWDGAREPWEVKPTHWMPLPKPPALPQEGGHE
jgi:hypothetical protein